MVKEMEHRLAHFIQLRPRILPSPCVKAVKLLTHTKENELWSVHIPNVTCRLHHIVAAFALHARHIKNRIIQE